MKIDIGLTSGPDFGLYPRSRLSCLYCSQRLTDEWGPDLALVDIVDSEADTLEARGKAFYNLTTRRSEALAAAPIRTAIWAVMGAPGEFVTEVGREPGVSRFDIGPTLIASAKVEVLTHDGFDYVEFPLDPKRVPTLFPKKYGGMSGCGLWRLGEANDEERTVSWTDKAFLEGVGFYHRWAAPEMIRCHGKQSIYRHLLDAL